MSDHTVRTLLDQQASSHKSLEGLRLCIWPRKWCPDCSQPRNTHTVTNSLERCSRLFTPRAGSDSNTNFTLVLVCSGLSKWLPVLTEVASVRFRVMKKLLLWHKALIVGFSCDHTPPGLEPAPFSFQDAWSGSACDYGSRVTVSYDI